MNEKKKKTSKIKAAKKMSRHCCILYMLHLRMSHINADASAWQCSVRLNILDLTDSNASDIKHDMLLFGQVCLLF